MNPEVKEKWVSALRSGEYAQGKGQLNKNNEEFCCLGVLCEIAVQEGIVAKRATGKIGWTDFGYDATYPDDSSTTRSIEYDVLPYKVREWAGIDSSNPDLALVVGEDEGFGLSYGAPGDRVLVPLSELNDTVNYTFSMLADAIEEQF